MAAIRTESIAVNARKTETGVCDSVTFTEFYRQHAQAAYGIALHLTEDHALAEDALQESMLRIWCALASFRPENVRGWILRIVTRECLRLLKSHKRQRMLASTAVALRPRHLVDESCEHTERSILLSALSNAVAALPAADRRLLKSCYEKCLSQRRISAATHMPQQTVSYRLKNVVHGLRRNLMQQARDESRAIPHTVTGHLVFIGD